MVQDAEGNPVLAFIEAIPLDENLQGNTSSDYTEPDGFFCMYVEKDTTIELCGTMTTDEDGGIQYSIDGKDIKIRTTDSGSIEIECDSGQTFVLNGDQLDAISGCSGSSGGDAAGVMCEAASGTYSSDCDTDLDCDGALACCGMNPGERKCYSPGECELYCASDAD